MTDNQLTMYLVINSDLKMTCGQIAAQVSHLTQIITEEVVRMGYETFPVQECYKRWMKWKINPLTIILKAPETELIKLLAKEESRGFKDSGERLGNGDECLTVVGFFPSELLKDCLKNYKLV